MDNNESIYEEIIAKETEIETETGELVHRKTGCSGCSKEKNLTSNLSKNNMGISAENEDSLYAVVNGDDLEFKKLGELLNDENHVTSREFNVAEIAQEQGSNFEETDSGCDCSQNGKELLESSTDLIRPNSLKLKKVNETVYSEILHLNPASQIDLRPTRLTRESNNPILRQEVVSSNSASPSSSKPSSRSGSFRRPRNGDSTRSGSGDSGIQEDFPSSVVYGNCTSSSRPISRQSSLNQTQVYENASPVKTPDLCREIIYSNVDDDEVKPKNAGEVKNDMQTVYENVENEEKRPRAASQPIAIQRKWSALEQELVYSDLDFKEEISTESLSSSPGESSASSWLSSSSHNNYSNSISPPPLPNRPASVYSRRRQTSFSSVSMSSYAASGLKAHFIGSQTVHRATSDSINSAITDVAHKNTMLDIKSVSVDVSKNVVHFGKLSPPYDCILQFSVDDIHFLDKFNKDDKFIGLIVSKPGKEAVCYVLQSDQSAEIIETIKEVFRENSKVCIIYLYPRER